MLLIYSLITLILIFCMLAYIPLARRLHIIDQPGERSSHHRPTVRGGGIIFLVAALLWFVWSGFNQPLALAGLLLIGVVSLADDMFTLPNSTRFAVHLLAATLLFMQMGIFSMHAWLVLAAFIITIGWINAFNFMDGINGITSFYSLVCLLSFALVNHAQWYIRLITPESQFMAWQSFLPGGLTGTMTVGVLVFSFFNARKYARVFAGDVGSISMAFMLAWMMIALMIHTREPGWILFFAVYGIDTVSTILIRLYRRENIFEAHRSHLYQLLANQYGWPHLKVAAMYALLQMVINVATIVLFFNGMLTWPVIFAFTVVLWFTYIILRIKIMNRMGH